MEEQDSALFSEIFPRKKIAANPRREMQRLLETNGADFLNMMQKTMRHFAVVRERYQITLQKIDFDGDENRLLFELDINAPEALDVFRQQLETDGFSVNIDSATGEGGTISGKMQIEW